MFLFLAAKDIKNAEVKRALVLEIAALLDYHPSPPKKKVRKELILRKPCHLEGRLLSLTSFT